MMTDKVANSSLVQTKKEKNVISPNSSNNNNKTKNKENLDNILEPDYGYVNLGSRIKTNQLDASEMPNCKLNSMNSTKSETNNVNVPEKNSDSYNNLDSNKNKRAIITNSNISSSPSSSSILDSLTKPIAGQPVLSLGPSQSFTGTIQGGPVFPLKSLLKKSKLNNNGSSSDTTSTLTPTRSQTKQQQSPKGLLTSENNTSATTTTNTNSVKSVTFNQTVIVFCEEIETSYPEEDEDFDYDYDFEDEFEEGEHGHVNGEIIVYEDEDEIDDVGRGYGINLEDEDDDEADTGGLIGHNLANQAELDIILQPNDRIEKQLNVNKATNLPQSAKISCDQSMLNLNQTKTKGLLIETNESQLTSNSKRKINNNNNNNEINHKQSLLVADGNLQSPEKQRNLNDNQHDILINSNQKLTNPDIVTSNKLKSKQQDQQNRKQQQNQLKQSEYKNPILSNDACDKQMARIGGDLLGNTGQIIDGSIDCKRKSCELSRSPIAQAKQQQQAQNQLNGVQKSHEITKKSLNNRQEYAENDASTIIQQTQRQNNCAARIIVQPSGCHICRSINESKNGTANNDQATSNLGDEPQQQRQQQQQQQQQQNLAIRKQSNSGEHLATGMQQETRDARVSAGVVNRSNGPNKNTSCISCRETTQNMNEFGKDIHIIQNTTANHQIRNQLEQHMQRHQQQQQQQPTTINQPSMNSQDQNQQKKLLIPASHILVNGAANANIKPIVTNANNLDQNARDIMNDNTRQPLVAATYQLVQAIDQNGNRIEVLSPVGGKTWTGQSLTPIGQIVYRGRTILVAKPTVNANQPFINNNGNNNNINIAHNGQKPATESGDRSITINTNNINSIAMGNIIQAMPHLRLVNSASSQSLTSSQMQSQLHQQQQQQQKLIQQHQQHQNLIDSRRISNQMQYQRQQVQSDIRYINPTTSASNNDIQGQINNNQQATNVVLANRIHMPNTTNINQQQFLLQQQQQRSMSQTLTNNNVNNVRQTQGAIYYVRQPINVTQSIRQTSINSVPNLNQAQTAGHLFADPREIRRLDGIRAPFVMSSEQFNKQQGRENLQQQQANQIQAPQLMTKTASNLSARMLKKDDTAFDDPTFGFSNRPSVKVVPSKN